MQTIQILKQLENFNAKFCDDFVEVSFPVLMDMDINCNCLNFKIISTENGYKITDTGKNFKELNHNLSFYYDLFVKSGLFNYNIQLENDIFYKNYEFNYNVVTALDEFIRFFISFDNFVMDNNLLAQ